jgi:uncharacterized protein YjiS (DUF1127 family)
MAKTTETILIEIDDIDIDTTLSNTTINNINRIINHLMAEKRSIEELIHSKVREAHELIRTQTPNGGVQAEVLKNISKMSLSTLIQRINGLISRRGSVMELKKEQRNKKTYYLLVPQSLNKRLIDEPTSINGSH